MTKPERIGMEMLDRIGHDFFNRGPDGELAPHVMRKRTMPTEDNHDLRVPLSAVHRVFTLGIEGSHE